MPRPACPACMLRHLWHILCCAKAGVDMQQPSFVRQLDPSQTISRMLLQTWARRHASGTFVSPLTASTKLSDL